ncbi:hypothetical protein AAF712_005210 [Marasmius tenuissimus]|uniref:SHSP domain-containing protein n=1 Tax=Marasmius tenuissimus TaxID=585030 RepID=A0ABR3A1F1_9AGAR
MSLPLPARVHADGTMRVINLSKGESPELLFDSPPSSPLSPRSATSPTTPISNSPSPDMFYRSPAPAPGLEVSRVSPPPFIHTSHSTTSSLFSPMERSRRTAPLSSSPSMKIHSSPANHTLQVKLPVAIQPEMVTISANKGAKLKVVADAWHLENDCHYEWLISFPPNDIDMTRVHAKFEEDGNLTIDVRRRRKYIV